MSELRTLIVPTEFETIQEAVDNAMGGDEVLILPGLYYENVIITTDDITIRGSAFPVEILGNGTGFGLTVEANDIKLINLDIKEFQVAVAFRGNNYVLEDVIGDENTEFGVVIFGDNGIIKSGSFSNNGIAGIVISGCKCHIINNRVNNNVEVGIGAFYGPFQDSIIEDNIIYAIDAQSLNNKSTGISLNLNSSIENTIQNNNISSNIAMVINGDKNTIENNIIDVSSRSALMINSDENDVIRNIIAQCPNGILINGNNNSVCENTINSISAIGILVNAKCNSIESNLIVDSKVGISSVADNNICHNRFVCVNKDLVIIP